MSSAIDEHTWDTVNNAHLQQIKQLNELRIAAEQSPSGAVPLPPLPPPPLLALAFAPIGVKASSLLKHRIQQATLLNWHRLRRVGIEIVLFSNDAFYVELAQALQIKASSDLDLK